MVILIYFVSAVLSGYARAAQAARIVTGVGVL